MERDVYAQMASQEHVHWWFVARREILSSLLSRHFRGNDRPLDILEAGCGTGGNLEMLARLGRVDAFEYDEIARGIASSKGIATVTRGELPHGVQQPDGAYDLVALLDVLEHIDADMESLQVLGQKLRPQGKLLITVPALPALWSDHDVRHHHKRRYSRPALRQVIQASGLQLLDIGFFNSLLLPLAVADRFASRVMGRGASEGLPPKPVNAFLRRIFALERFFVGTRLHTPAGLSLFAVAQRP